MLKRINLAMVVEDDQPVEEVIVDILQHVESAYGVAELKNSGFGHMLPNRSSYKAYAHAIEDGFADKIEKTMYGE